LIFVLQGRDADADQAADESRQLGSLDDAVTQTLWRAAKCIVLARRGDAAEADRISRECVDIADGTDSMDAGTAWLARAEVLAIAGRRAEAADAARRARDLYARKGWASAIRRAEALLAG
jgi:tetratricopeptide (TPR) repeat protein